MCVKKCIACRESNRRPTDAGQAFTAAGAASGGVCLGNNLRAFGGGVDAVCLDGARYVNQVLVDHGHKSYVMRVANVLKTSSNDLM